MKKTPQSIFICAGEPSGDLLGAELAAALRQHQPNLSLRGMGGEQMQKAGVKLSVNCHDLAIVGLAEVIKQLPKIRRVMKTIVNELKQNPPDLLILIDYPGFNLRLAKAAKKLGIKVFYYSCPQIWAWHYSRIKKIKKYIDHMLTLFPFEETLYKKENMPATFVGHPMVQRITPQIPKADAYKKYGLDPKKPIVALLPGSRESEIQKLLTDILAAAQRIKEKCPDTQFILPVSENLNAHTLMPTGFTKEIKLIHHHRYDALQCADAAIAVSGTVTLELALLQIPMIIIYRISKINFLLAKCLVQTTHFGLCNIVAEEEIAKEALQDDVNPENIANEIIKLIENQPYRTAILNKLSRLKEKMGTLRAADKAADVVLTNP